jgi:AcrR family transcriptional regulator
MNQPTRERILDAAERLMRSIGLARVTTKQIAQAAGCSEGALYKHFSSKEELFVRVLEERLPSLDPLLAELSSDPGDRSITDCVAVIARQAARFYESTFAIGASLFAEPSLLARHRDAIRTLGTGPHRPLDAVADYLRTEQKAKRLRTDASAEAAAALLMGACYHRAFFTHYFGKRPAESLDNFATGIATTIVTGIGTTRVKTDAPNESTRVNDAVEVDEPHI